MVKCLALNQKIGVRISLSLILFGFNFFFSNKLTKLEFLIESAIVLRPHSLADKASDFESEDWLLESLCGRFFLVLADSFSLKLLWLYGRTA